MQLHGRARRIECWDCMTCHGLAKHGQCWSWPCGCHAMAAAHWCMLRPLAHLGGLSGCRPPAMCTSCGVQWLQHQGRGRQPSSVKQHDCTTPLLQTDLAPCMWLTAKKPLSVRQQPCPVAHEAAHGTKCRQWVTPPHKCEASPNNAGMRLAMHTTGCQSATLSSRHATHAAAKQLATPHPPTKMGDTHSRHATHGRSLSSRGGTAATAAAMRRSSAAAAASAASSCFTSVPTRRTCAGEVHDACA